MTTPTRLFSRILSLAIQGKLVSNHADDTVDDLLKEIAANNSARKKSKSDPISDEQIPFQIPDNWKWVRLGEICECITKGASPSWQGVKYVDEGILFITSENVGNGTLLLNNKKYLEPEFNKIQPRSILKKGDILTNIVGASIGRTTIFDLDLDDCNINQAVAIIRLIDLSLSSYILYMMQSQFFINQILLGVVETARANISLSTLSSLPFPLPPLSVQSRIVFKLNEIKALVDDCEDIENGLEKDCELLRKKVLDLALRGRLTTQLPSDGDAQSLIDQIEAEKAKSSAKNKKYIPPQPVNPDDAPFQIPNNWKWVRLGEVFEIVTGSTPSKSNPSYYNGGIPFYKPSDMDKGWKINSSVDTLSEEGYQVSRRLPKNSIIVCCIGSIGKCSVITKEGTCNQQINAILPNNSINVDFIYYTINSTYFQQLMLDASYATTIAILNKANFSELPIPLPPLAEQQRIVAKIEEVFAQIDNLRV